MNDKQFLHQDFYTIQRHTDEDKVIALLHNNVDLSVLLEPIVTELVEYIYQHLTGSNKQFSISQEQITQVDEILKRTLEKEQSFIVPAGISDAVLFSSSFKSIWDKVFDREKLVDTKYTIERNLQLWIEFEIARTVTKDDRFSSPSLLNHFFEAVDFSDRFYNWVIDIIPSTWVDKAPNEWIKVSDKPEAILDSMRSFDQDYLKSYKNIDSTSLTAWRHIEESTRYSDYIMLNEDYSFRSAVLLKHNIALWVQLWDNFQHPVVQDSIFFSTRFCVEDFISIAQQIVLQKASFKTPYLHLVLLLAKNFFEVSLAASEKLSFYTDEERFKYQINSNSDSAAVIQAGQIASQNWHVTRDSMYMLFFEALQPIISEVDLEEFIFSYKHRSQPQNAYTSIFNSEVDLITNAYRKVLISKDYTLTPEAIKANFNLEKFNFYVALLATTENFNELIAKELLSQLLTFTESQNYFWDQSLADPYWTTMKGFAFLLSKIAEPTKEAKKIVNLIKVSHEGWNVDSTNYQHFARESFFYCALVLLVEHKDVFAATERQAYFKELVELIIKQSRFSVVENEYYIRPLVVCYAVVSQVYQELRPYFEVELITWVDELYVILIVLSTIKDELLTPEAREILVRRANKELPFELRKIRRNGLQDKQEFWAKAIERFELE